MFTVWEFETANFRVALEAEQDTDLDLSWDEDGETAEKLASGEWTAYQFKVAVYDRHNGAELGADYLGGSIYADAREFVDHRAVGRANREHAAAGRAGRCGSYFKDMVASAIAEARRVQNAPRARLRLPN